MSSSSSKLHRPCCSFLRQAPNRPPPLAASPFSIPSPCSAVAHPAARSVPLHRHRHLFLLSLSPSNSLSLSLGLTPPPPSAIFSRRIPPNPVDCLRFVYRLATTVGQSSHANHRLFFLPGSLVRLVAATSFSILPSFCPSKQKLPNLQKQFMSHPFSTQHRCRVDFHRHSPAPSSIPSSFTSTPPSLAIRPKTVEPNSNSSPSQQPSTSSSLPFFL